MRINILTLDVSICLEQEIGCNLAVDGKSVVKKVFDNTSTVESFDMNVHRRISTGLPSCENHEWEVYSKPHYDGFMQNTLSCKAFPGSVIMTDGHYNGYRKFLTELTECGNDLNNVHMSGLGLGTMIPVILSYKNIKMLNVVEISKSLIDLIGPFYKQYTSDGRLKITCADARKYDMGEAHYDLAFHDIWTANDNKERIDILKKYQNNSTKQACWTRT